VTVTTIVIVIGTVTATVITATMTETGTACIATGITGIATAIETKSSPPLRLLVEGRTHRPALEACAASVDWALTEAANRR
jgi:hypothetical protein